MIGRLVRALAWAAGAAVAVVAVLLALLWLQHRAIVTLPAPTGAFAVGRGEYDWVDSTRVDSTAPPAAPLPYRVVVAWVWYPAPRGSAVPGAGVASFLPLRWRRALDQARGLFARTFLFHDPARVRVHALRLAPLAPDSARYPVLLFEPGLGLLAADYTSLAEDLASHGYVVVGINPTHSEPVALTDGRVLAPTPAGDPGDVRDAARRDTMLDRLIRFWAGDYTFVLGRLERLDRGEPVGRFRGRLRLDSIGVFGHSFGGAAAALFCRDEPRCRAGMDLDGWPYGDVVRTGIGKPFLFILSDRGAASGAEGRRMLAAIRSLARRAPNRPALLTLGGSGHFNFSDRALLVEPHLMRWLGLVGPIDTRRALTSTAGVVTVFFDDWLRGVAHAGTPGASPPPPLTLSRRRTRSDRS